MPEPGGEDIEVTWHDEDDAVVLEVRGEVDVYSVRVFEDALARLRPLSRPLALDLAGVTFFDSSGVRAVLAARRAAVEDCGVPARVVVASAIVRKVLEMTGVAHHLLDATNGDEAG